MKKWKIEMPDPQLVSQMQNGSDLSELCCTVLVSQGCTTLEKAAGRFGSDTISDPASICDMQAAADTILAAVDSDKRICIYGDYDCDGVMATVILYSFLYESGANVTWRIPERAEGYGLNMQAVKEMHEDGVELIVTVDNGISAIAEADYIRELGMDLVITDHHQPGTTLPHALAIVDAHREDNASTFRLYCGAGIALLLVAAMNDGDVGLALEQFGDLAAIATIADVVSLTGENRRLVQMGLEYLENTERPGLIALREAAGLTKQPLTAANIAFGIAPRINSAGRIRSPRLAVELLTEESLERARNLAAKLEALNADRKAFGEEIYAAVRQYIEQDVQCIYERVLFFSGEDWHPGIIGITAARLLERFGKPCFIVSIKDGIGHGSVRSFGDFSVFACLTFCADLLEKYGGHPAAGGFTVRAENIPALQERIAQYAAQTHPTMPVMELHAACVLRRELLNPDLVRTLSQLEPFGTDNPEPLFLAKDSRILDIRPVSNGVHTKLILDVDGVSCEAMLFRTAPTAAWIQRGDCYHFLVQLSVNTWMGQQKLSMKVVDYRPAHIINQNKMLAAMDTYERYRRGEPLPAAYYREIVPTRTDCVQVYQELPGTEVRIERLANQVYRCRKINYCKMRICLDCFAELGVIAYGEGENFVRRLPSEKVNLEDSEVLKRIIKLAKEANP